jgi:hypothetical protein
MSGAITLSISHATIPAGPVEGFRFLWAFYVSGYRSDRHCQPCFRGSRVTDFSTSAARSGRRFELTRAAKYPCVYVCGVGRGPKTELHRRNLHLPMRFSAGSVVRAMTYNGYEFVAEDAELIEVPALPPGWNGLELETTRCRNFQLAVSLFGYPSLPARRTPTSAVAAQPGR